MNNVSVKFRRIIPFVLFAISITLFSLDCSNPKNPGQLKANIPPKTRLSNVPPLDVVSTMDKPRATLNWVGDDPDGFVAAFRYTWTYSEDGVEKEHPYKYVLNYIVEGFTLMVQTQDLSVVPVVYNYFSTLPSETGLDPVLKDSLARGDSIWVRGVQVYASNPESIKVATGERIKYLFPVHDNPNKGTFIFDSPDSINFHTFKVAAIDNQGSPSTVPATVSFLTPSVKPPNTKITLSPPAGSFVLSESTATFRGLAFQFQGIDPNTRLFDYRWVVDKDKWIAKIGHIPWSDFSIHDYAWVQASDFPDPYDTIHTFYVQSRNEYGAIDTVGWYKNIIMDANGDSIGYYIDSAQITFTTSYPRFRRPDLPEVSKILLLNESQNGDGSLVYPYRADLDSFYIKIFTDLGVPRADISVDWVGYDQRGLPYFPSRSKIAEHSLVFLYGDIMVPSTLLLKDSLQLTYTRQAVIRDFCYVGGRFMMSGWGMMRPVNMQRADPPDPAGFPDRILHVSAASAKLIIPSPSKAGDCIGATGVIGYPDLHLDTTKLDTAWHNGLAFAVATYPSGFGEIIQKYASLSGNTTYEQVPVSVRYKGITFNTVYYGVPLYYMQRPGVDSALAIGLRDLKDNTYINNATKRGN